MPHPERPDDPNVPDVPRARLRQHSHTSMLLEIADALDAYYGAYKPVPNADERAFLGLTLARRIRDILYGGA